MVQRKAPSKLGSQTISAKKPERHLSSSHQQQESSNKVEGEIKMKMKMKEARCINMADLEIEHVQLNQSASHRRGSYSTSTPRSMPNYMKPTSSSDARKERLQVTRNPPTAAATDHRKRNQRNLNSSNSSQAASGPKPVRVLRRKLSSITLRLSMKKSLGTPPCPKPKLNRATCSSTLKDSKFPRALELNPGATEAEGTSVMKVCPYKYCSLNGHVHDALPPLKCFLASRRKLLKTQKCMKQKGISPFRRQGSGKDLDTGQAAVRTRSGLEIYSLIEEIGSDFFVEIYAKPQELITEPVKCDETSIQETLENLNESVGSGNQLECSKCEDDDERKNLVDVIHETYSDVSFKDDLDQSSELSIDDLEIMTSFLEYVSCDQEHEADKEKIPSLTTEDYIGVGKDSEDHPETDNKMEMFESIDIDLEEDLDPFSDDKSNFSAYSDDELGPILEKLFEIEHHNETAENETEAHREVCSRVLEPESLQDNGDSDSRYENISESAAACEEKEELAVSEQDSMIISDQLVNPDSIPELSDEISKKTDLTDSDGEEAGNEKVEKSSLSEVHIPAANQELTPIDNDIKDDDQIQTEAEVESNDCNTDDKELIMDNLSSGVDEFLSPSTMKNKEGKVIKTAVTNQSPTDDDSDPNVKISIIRKRATEEESEDTKEFNPRPPNFLPEEPDPEAEKVDLKHQMMDERKNAEEWMIDYALQRAVTKLAPARRQKVALLVEAFETVIPLPVCDKPLRHANPSFSNPRPLQACS